MRPSSVSSDFHQAFARYKGSHSSGIDGRMGLVVEDTCGQEKVNAEPREEYTPYHPQKGYGWAEALPVRQGLYDPQLEKDACGVGFAA